MQEYKRLTVNLEPAYLEGLKALAQREGIPMGIFLRLRIHALVDGAGAFSLPAVPVANRRTAHNNHAEAAR